jgi:hypothetical protein
VNRPAWRVSQAVSTASASYADRKASKRKGPTVGAACRADGSPEFVRLARLSKAPIAAEAVKRVDVRFAI